MKYADKYKDDAKSPDSIYNAGIFYLGLGDTESAVKMFTRYIKDFPKQKDIPDVYLRMAAVYEDKEDWKRAAAMYGDFEKLARQEQHAREGPRVSLQDRAHAAEERPRQRHARGVQGHHRRLEEARRRREEDRRRRARPAATAASTCSRPSGSTTRRSRSRSARRDTGKKGMKVVAEALDLKKKKRDEIAKKYFDLKDYGSGEWAVAGLLRAADALLDYVDTLRNAPDPAVLANNPEALDIFRGELENIAFPVEEQGIGALEAALETAFKLGIYSPYTIEIEDRLRKFKPAKFGRIYELPFFPSATVSSKTRTASR